MDSKLDAAAREVALADLPLWSYDPTYRAIARDFHFPGFVDAFGFMTRVALLAERANHHPDWSNVWNQVRVALTTHDAGGVTAQDIALAAAIDRLA